MAMLSPETDRAVRHAVDAYLSGRRRPQVEGEIFFSTRNHRYRLIDGVLFSVSQPGQEAERGRALLGAEFVGWLHEDEAGSHVKLGWRPGARAVLVDPRRGHHIVVTSNTHAPQDSSVEPPKPLRPRQTDAPPPPLARAGSMFPQVGSAEIQPPARVELAIPPPARLPSMMGVRAPHPPPRPIRQHRTDPPPASEARPMRPVPAPIPPPRRAFVQGMRLQ